MRARKYNKKVELWQTSLVSDGFGGSGVSPNLLKSIWCKFITLDRISRSTDLGLTETTNTLIIQLRKRSDFDFNSETMFFKYRGDNYMIQSEPINVGFEDREIQITLKKSVNA